MHNKLDEKKFSKQSKSMLYKGKITKLKDKGSKGGVSTSRDYNNDVDNLMVKAKNVNAKGDDDWDREEI